MGCVHCAGDLYHRLDVRLTGVARGTAPHTPDGALAALHLADLALWLAPRAPFVRALHMRLPSPPARAAGAEGTAEGTPCMSAGDEAVEEAVAACCHAELVSLLYEDR